MRRNRKNSIKKERIIMLASSAFVLAALTLTGVYMNGKEAESKDDGYTLDFATLEENADDKFDEIAQNNTADKINENESVIIEDELDYMPVEVGSGQIEIPGLTKYKEIDSGASGAIQDNLLTQGKEGIIKNEEQSAKAEAAETEKAEAEVPVSDTEEVFTDNAVAEQSFSFSEANGILRPLSGDVLLHYSMGSSVYFATLDQYKYNPAVILAAVQGEPVSACAPGKVVDIYNDSQTGATVVVDLGNGYQATYGQLEDITVSLDSYVNEGDIIAYVAAPTKYYSLEGTNLYFALRRDGNPINPETLFR